MKAYRHFKSDQLGDKLNQQLKKDLSAPVSEAELFSFASFDPDASERGGYSNYSYWRATLRAFFKNRVAVFFLLVLVCTLAFTFIQPNLPNQRNPITIHYNEAGRTLANLARTSGPGSGRVPAPASSSASPSPV